jgi:hypothetical protein
MVEPCTPLVLEANRVGITSYADKSRNGQDNSEARETVRIFARIGTRRRYPYYQAVARRVHLPKQHCGWDQPNHSPLAFSCLPSFHVLNQIAQEFEIFVARQQNYRYSPPTLCRL